VKLILAQLVKKWTALYATLSFFVSQLKQPTQSLSVQQLPPLHTHFVTVATKVAPQLSLFCICLHSRLFSISVIISFLLICYISLFSLILFVSAILFKSLAWLIYFSFLVSLFPYLYTYFFRNLFMSVFLLFFAFYLCFSFFCVLFLCFLLFPYLVLFLLVFLVSTVCLIIPFFPLSPASSLSLFFSVLFPAHFWKFTHTTTIRISQWTVPHTDNSCVRSCLSFSNVTLSPVFVYR
jgi:hypothetical protein